MSDERTRDSTISDRALALARAGISVMPTNRRTKKPYGVWKHLQSAIMTPAEIRRAFAPHVESVAVIGGRVSGGLCIIDFDIPEFRDAWLADVECYARNLPVWRTGREGGGFQYAMRCDNPGRNRRLAAVPDATEPCGYKVAIETRAEGGYANVPPSTHPTGRRYANVHLDLLDVPYVPQDIADFLIDAAKALNQVDDLDRRVRQQTATVAQQQKLRQPRMTGNAAQVIDAYVAKHDIGDALAARGYDVRRDEFTRPGKAFHDGTSGHILTFADGRRRAIHFSTNDPLNDEKFGGDGATCGVSDAFDVLVQLDHRGDWRGAVRAAAVELGMNHRRDVDVLDEIMRTPGQAYDEFASIYTGDLTSVEGNVDAAILKLDAILKKHSRSDDQIARMIAKSALPIEAEVAQ